MERSVVLEVDGVGKAFGALQVLKGASFRAREGQVTALMGRNGTGKSTLLRLVIGRPQADYGRIRFRGTFVPRPRLAELAHRGLFYSAQDSALTKLFTVRQHLMAVARAWGGGHRVEEAVARLGLEPFLDRRPATISGGERQRASLAMALVRAPVCLLMDEPFSGITPADRARVTDGLAALCAGGCAVVLTGHDVADIFEVSHEVVWVVAGTTEMLGSPETARDHPRFRREYLGA